MENLNSIIQNYPLQIQGIYHDLVIVELTELMISNHAIVRLLLVATKAALQTDFDVMLYGRPRLWRHNSSLIEENRCIKQLYRNEIDMI